MERYIIMFWIKDSPGGGGRDCIGSKDSEIDAINQLEQALDNNIQEYSNQDYCGHIFDAKEKKVIYNIKTNYEEKV